MGLAMAESHEAPCEKLVTREQQKQPIRGPAVGVAQRERSWRLGVARGGGGPDGASPSGPTDFHLRALEGVVEALPLGPVDAIGIGEVGATKVEAVEVGKVAATEPEGS